MHLIALFQTKKKFFIFDQPLRRILGSAVKKLCFERNRKTFFWIFFEIFENSCFFRRGGEKVDNILAPKKLFRKNFLAGFKEQRVGFLPV